MALGASGRLIRVPPTAEGRLVESPAWSSFVAFATESGAGSPGLNHRNSCRQSGAMERPPLCRVLGRQAVNLFFAVLGIAVMHGFCQNRFDFRAILKYGCHVAQIPPGVSNMTCERRNVIPAQFVIGQRFAIQPNRPD